MPLTFITGPVRSGKSRFAERLAVATGGSVIYVATARMDAGDPEWTARIAHHAARRPAAWRLVETARGEESLPDLLRTSSAATTLLVDSLGTWLADRISNRLQAAGEAAAVDADALEAELSEVVDAALGTAASAIVVGEEVGWGLVPPYPAGRLFRDVLGRAQQRLAAGASQAYLVVAGHAIDLHRAGIRVEP